MEAEQLIHHVKQGLKEAIGAWVLFRHGTCVVFRSPDQITDLEGAARLVMAQEGRVFPGTPTGDFRVIFLDQTEGYAVAYHYPDMYTYVHPSELEAGETDELTIGYYGRAKRIKDAEELSVIHVKFTI